MLIVEREPRGCLLPYIGRNVKDLRGDGACGALLIDHEDEDIKGHVQLLFGR